MKIMLEILADQLISVNGIGSAYGGLQLMTDHPCSGMRMALSALDHPPVSD